MILLDRATFGNRVAVTAVARRFIGDRDGVHESDQVPMRGRYPKVGYAARRDAWHGQPIETVGAPAGFVVEPPFEPLPRFGSSGASSPGVRGVKVRWRRLDAIDDDTADPLIGTLASIAERWEGTTQPASRYSGFDGDESDSGWFEKERRLSFAEVLVDNWDLRRRSYFVLADPADCNPVVTVDTERFLKAFQPNTEDRHSWRAEADEIASIEGSKWDDFLTAVQRDGIRVPVRIGTDGQIWNGHHRVCAALELALPTFDAELVSNTPEWPPRRKMALVMVGS